ncbi:MAG: hypothetical protein BWY95_02390 [Bacteroidetes bacterium ADurb.BinA104]|nr:MAG: hypothetical protein BWY95_02390 [Bacteroidetes bacterium ADurb.BinA104]
MFGGTIQSQRINIIVLWHIRAVYSNLCNLFVCYSFEYYTLNGFADIGTCPFLSTVHHGNNRCTFSPLGSITYGIE